MRNWRCECGKYLFGWSCYLECGVCQGWDEEYCSGCEGPPTGEKAWLSESYVDIDGSEPLAGHKFCPWCGSRLNADGTSNSGSLAWYNYDNE